MPYESGGNRRWWGITGLLWAGLRLGGYILYIILVLIGILGVAALIYGIL